MTSFRNLRLISVLALTLLRQSTADYLWSEPQDHSGDVLGGFSSACTSEDPKNASVSCQGVRIVRRIIQQFLDKSSVTPYLELSSGVQLVRSTSSGGPRYARNMRIDGIAGQVVSFLQGRELRIKLPSILPDNFESAVKESLPSVNQGRGKGGGFGGGGGKKGGDGGVMLMAMMMGKMLSALGFGALALLAMKALMVSALALMLSLIVAAKKLAGGHDDGGGHHVVYAQEVGHHGHKRSLDDLYTLELPYRGYNADYAVQNS